MNRYLQYCLFIFFFTSYAFNIACTPSEVSNNDNGHKVQQANLGEVQPANIDIELIAQTVSKDIALIKEVYEGTSSRNIFILEERHNSISGQIELAFVLNRLAEQFNIKDIRLEGAFANKGRVESKHFNQLMDKVKNKASSPQLRVNMASRFLAEGEISSAEFMALVHPDVSVYGIENETEYSTDISTDAYGAFNVYLYHIVSPSMTQSQQNNFGSLIEQNEGKKAFEYLCSLNSFVKMRYNLLTADTVLGAEKTRDIYKEIKQKAESINANIDDKFKRGIDQWINFYDMALRRDHTMVKYTINDGAQNCSMIIGAAHTAGVTQVLKAQGHSYAVIRPVSLQNQLKEGDLSFESYERKMHKRSVDTSFLAQILYKEKKPEPIINEDWFKAKSELNIAILLLLETSGGGKGPIIPNTPPYKELWPVGLNNQFNFINVDPETIDFKDGEISFKVNIRIHNKEEELWIKTAQLNSNNEGDINLSIESNLKAVYEAILRKSELSDDEIFIGGKKRKVNKSDKSVVIKAVSPNAIAAISKSKTAIAKAKVNI